jgi:hypothetical protein
MARRPRRLARTTDSEAPGRRMDIEVRDLADVGIPLPPRTRLATATVCR